MEGAGIDTVKAWTETAYLPDNYMDKLPALLENCTEHNHKRRGRYVTGNLGNLNVRLNKRKLTIVGSLQKFIHFCGLPYDYPNVFKSIDTALGLMFDTLGLPHDLLPHFKISRIDYYLDLCMEQPPTSYYGSIAALKRMERVISGNSLYFNSRAKRSVKTFSLYDKGQKIKQPETNLLRIEVRYLEGIKKELGWAYTFADLQKPETHLHLLRKWKYYFDNLKIINTPKMEKKPKTKKEFDDFLILQGDLKTILEQLAESDLSRSDKSKKKKELLELFAKHQTNDTELRDKALKLYTSTENSITPTDYRNG